ncbi:50S ribosomal protein L23 [Mycoplasmopsis gallinarum]|uniref:Large ribosomal subunit protein uL23 n=1 Tax=Mycoplasmopsis gallinarum TaxID=29557 RepID=A0A168RN50_9BACT|nr:50S ribosomal protein L23 [Mycoplasmopsis gallinarum]OAB49135.1 LSU ribosomal protein L23p (L23Ae) [Mycoplasmopsis gallinarum]
MELTRVIHKPILTEKTNLLQGQNTYTFEVDYAANKYQIKNAVEFIFQVKVEAVNTIKVDKKAKRLGRFNGFTNRYKKAMVTLKDGYVINFYPNEEENKAQVEAEKEAKAKEEKAKNLAKEAQLEAKLSAKKAKSATKISTKTVRKTVARSGKEA